MSIVTSLSLAALLLLACNTHNFIPSTSEEYLLIEEADVKNGEPIKLKPTSPAEESLNLSQPERASTIAIISSPATYRQTIKPSNTVRKTITQTGQADSTRQTTAKAVIDIAIVVDESTSISRQTLRDVANKLSKKLTDVLAGSDWKIAVTGSSIDSSYFKTLSSKSTSSGDNSETACNKLVGASKTLCSMMVGVREHGTNHGNELLIDNAVKLINNKSWQRRNADSQVVLLITDEDLQCKRGGVHTFHCEESVRESHRLSKQWKLKANNRSVFGIINLANDTCRAQSNLEGDPCYNRPDTHQLKKHNYLKTCHLGYNSCYKNDGTGTGTLVTDKGSAHLFDLIADIKSKDFDDIMAAITKKVKDKLLTVKIPGEPFINSIAIGHKASEVANLVVKITDNNSTVTIPSTLYLVKDYKITLNPLPKDLPRLFPSDAILSVSYAIADKNRSFPLPQSRSSDAKVLVNKSVAAWVNGVFAPFTINGSHITLRSSLPANAILTVSAQYLKTVYDLAQQTHRIDGGNTTCMKAGSPVSCVHDRNSLRFDKPNQIAAGDKIIATQLVDVLASNGEQLLTLNSGYIEESVRLKANNNTCAHNQLTFVGNMINLSTSACLHLKKLTNTDIIVNYRTYDNTSSFSLDVPESMLADDNWSVGVKIGDRVLKAGEDYVIDQAKKTIHFLKMESINYDSTAITSYSQ